MFGQKKKKSQEAILQEQLTKVQEWIKGKSNEEVFALLGELISETILKLEEQPGRSKEEALLKATERLNKISAVLRDGGTCVEALGIDRDFIESLYGEGYRMYQAGLYAKALPLFNGLYFLDKKDTRLVMNAAACHQMLKNYPMAIRRYRQAAEMDAESPMPFFYLYECHMRLSEPDKAGEALEELVRRAEASPKYQNRLEKGRVLLQGHMAQYGGSKKGEALKK